MQVIHAGMSQKRYMFGQVSISFFLCAFIAFGVYFMRLCLPVGNCSKEVELVAMFKKSLSLAEHTSSLAARHFRNASESVALGSWPGEVLEMCEVLCYEALLFSSDGTRSTLLHQVKD